MRLLRQARQAHDLLGRRLLKNHMTKDPFERTGLFCCHAGAAGRRKRRPLQILSRVGLNNVGAGLGPPVIERSEIKREGGVASQKTVAVLVHPFRIVSETRFMTRKNRCDKGDSASPKGIFCLLFVALTKRRCQAA